MAAANTNGAQIQGETPHDFKINATATRTTAMPISQYLLISPLLWDSTYLEPRWSFTTVVRFYSNRNEKPGTQVAKLLKFRDLWLDQQD